MEPLKTGSTLERIIRHGIFTVILVFYSAWLFYDGYYRYPADNLEDAKQYVPAEVQDEVTLNPRVVRKRVQHFQKGDRLSDVEQELGSPAWTSRVDLGNRQTNAQAFWFGPGGTFIVQYDSYGTLREDPGGLRPAKHSELDLVFQKVTGVITGVLGLYLIVHMVGILIRRAVLSEAGLKHRGHPLIPFEAMTGWDPGQYRDRGWIRLHYNVDGREGTVVLDDYKLKAFPAIVAEICRRKGFENPLEKKGRRHN